MRCIFCGNIDSKVVDSRYLKDSSIRRRRECLVCGKRFTTYETVETNPMIVTNVRNEREPFKTEKLMDSIKHLHLGGRADGHGPALHGHRHHPEPHQRLPLHPCDEKHEE